MSPSAETPTKGKKKKEKVEEESQDVQVTANAQTVIKVQNRKIAELDQQNTMLQAMCLDQDAHIKSLQATIDALAAEPKNREQRRKKAKTSGK